MHGISADLLAAPDGAYSVAFPTGAAIVMIDSEDSTVFLSTPPDVLTMALTPDAWPVFAHAHALFSAAGFLYMQICDYASAHAVHWEPLHAALAALHPKSTIAPDLSAHLVPEGLILTTCHTDLLDGQKPAPPQEALTGTVRLFPYADATHAHDALAAQRALLTRAQTLFPQFQAS